MSHPAIKEGRTAVITDVSRLPDVGALREAAMNRFGGIAVLMHNAGTGEGGGAFASYDGWQKVLGVNLWRGAWIADVHPMSRPS